MFWLQLNLSGPLKISDISQWPGGNFHPLSPSRWLEEQKNCADLISLTEVNEVLEAMPHRQQLKKRKAGLREHLHISLLTDIQGC